MYLIINLNFLNYHFSTILFCAIGGIEPNPYLTPIHIHCLELYTFGQQDPPVRGSYSHQYTVINRHLYYVYPRGDSNSYPKVQKTFMLHCTTGAYYMQMGEDSNFYSPDSESEVLNQLYYPSIFCGGNEIRTHILQFQRLR